MAADPGDADVGPARQGGELGGPAVAGVGRCAQVWLGPEIGVRAPIVAGKRAGRGPSIEVVSGLAVREHPPLNDVVFARGVEERVGERVGEQSV